MKKIVYIILVLAMLLSLCACGEKTEQEALPVALGYVYESFSASLPEMLPMEGDMRLNMLGIKDEDCKQVYTYICGEGLKADEVWLIEAVDEAALERIEGLAQSRKTAKMDETSFYSPDQFAICEDGRIISEGLYLALIVSPEADALEKIFLEAVK